MTLAEEFKSRNFSIYGQWTGVLCIVLCFAIGLANIFSKFIVFGIISLVYSPILLFIEVPFLLRICPTSSKFDSFIRRFTTNFMRAAVYAGMSAGLWISLIIGASSLIATAVLLAIAGIFYAVAGLMKQDFTGSKTLGGQGVAQMIV
ncbi:Golgi apparatus membrane protein tvp18 [Emydomyces testavorans]|uniref:Golgi apparatus membrane protein tvp18 n=1 Tax=Emydomyces testavorans TaxID=2070801 RepID=A0AAF0DBB5_9EURO|nr:Golgi apparatus membrane protein tvp18 [Emydomyces testavorans]